MNELGMHLNAVPGTPEAFIVKWSAVKGRPADDGFMSRDGDFVSAASPTIKLMNPIAITRGYRFSIMPL